MQNESYEEYIRNILGYPNISQDTNVYSNYTQAPVYRQNYANTYIQNSELENCYPEIYNIIYPMVKKVCMQNANTTVNKQLLEDMTEEIYMAIEGNTQEIENRKAEKQTVKKEIVNSKEMQFSKKEIESRKVDTKESMQIEETRNSNDNNRINIQNENRQIQNLNLRDLIKILILRELLGRPTRPSKPPFPGIRPPFPNMRKTRYEFFRKIKWTFYNAKKLFRFFI